MNKNEYYILEASKISLVSNDDIVDDEKSVRWSVDKSKFVCKTKEGIKNSKALSSYTPMSHSEIRVEMIKPEWNIPIN